MAKVAIFDHPQAKEGQNHVFWAFLAFFGFPKVVSG
jgi:hypothetical protein